MLRLLKKIYLLVVSKFNQFFFVGSTDILPPPLDKEEEIELVIKSQKGEIEARNKLIEHNLRLVVFIAEKYESKLETLEEWDSLSMISTVAFLDKEFSTKITIEDVKNFKTVGDVAKKVGL